VDQPRRERFEGLYREHYGAVRGYLLRRAAPELASDALSEIFLAAWRRLDELPADDPLPWLIGTARKALANQRRSARCLGALRELREAPPHRRHQGAHPHGAAPGREARARRLVVWHSTC